MIKKMNDSQTGSQRLVQLYRWLSQGFSIRPSEYAKEQGIERQSVYHQLNQLRNMGLPIVNIDYGEWAFGDFREVSKFDFMVMAFGYEKRTPAQQLVELYRDLVRGYDISPTKYAKQNGIRRQTVYRQFDLLSQVGIPVTNAGKGWTLMEYMEYMYD